MLKRSEVRGLRSEWAVVLMLVTTGAFAQVRSAAAAVKPLVQLQCPSGAQQVVEADAVLCAQVSQGQRVFHGPYVAFWPNGVRQSEGQYVDGFRSGRWVFHDANGVPSGETWFKAGSYDGLRVELNPDGSKRLEEQWVAGKRQGAQKQWSAAGVLTVTEFRDDRPLAR